MDTTIVGCGYTGRRLAARCHRKGEDVIALVRTSASRQHLDAMGVAAHRVDLDEAIEGGLPAAFTAGRRLIYMVPPAGSGAKDERMARFLAALKAPPAVFVYLSTSAVYGARDGATVNEDAAVEPASDRGRRRLDAEQRASAWGKETGVPVRILRVPGIYGPGRLPLDRLRRGGPVVESMPSRPGNRIHVDDLARVCLAACRYRGPLEIFNVGDGDPMDMGTFMALIVREAGLPPPTTRTLDQMMAAATPMGREFLGESRRLDVSRMRDALGFAPRFADPALGISACLEEIEARLTD